MTKNILWLPSWYPDKISPYNGDFIQRHAKAVANFHPVQVIYIVRDLKGIVTRDVKAEDVVSGDLSEKIIYYYSSSFRLSIIDKLFSNLKYKKLYRNAVADYLKQHGNPFLIHVHVAMKAGLIARWIKRKFKLPFVISEHWTGYLPEANEKFTDYPVYLKMIWKRIMRSASGFSVVSDYLGSCIKKEYYPLEYKIIPNVVDTGIFKPEQFYEQKITQFIHISGLNYQKNPQHILGAFKILKQKYSGFHLSVVGPHREELIQQTIALELEQFVSFHSEMPQKDLAKLIQQSHALILYSRYETFGCVIIEANACGVPVIVSDLKVFHEIVEEKGNGVFVPDENPELLAEKLYWFIQNQQQFEHTAIATQARSKYSYTVVGKQFSDWYYSVLKNS